MKIPIGPQRVTTWDTLHPPQKQPLPWQRLFVTNNVASSEQKYSLQSGYTAWERTQYVPALPSVAQDMNVTVDICTWFLLQTLIHCPLLLLYFSRMSSSDPLLMSQSAADLFATLIKFFYSAEIWRLKQSAGSLSLSLCLAWGDGLPAPSRWERIHIFSWLSWPQEASRNSTQQPSAEQKQPHSLCLNVHARLSLITKEEQR